MQVESVGGSILRVDNTGVNDTARPPGSTSNQRTSRWVSVPTVLRRYLEGVAVAAWIARKETTLLCLQGSRINLWRWWTGISVCPKPWRMNKLSHRRIASITLLTRIKRLPRFGHNRKTLWRWKKIERTSLSHRRGARAPSTCQMLTAAAVARRRILKYFLWLCAILVMILRCAKTLMNHKRQRS